MSDTDRADDQQRPPRRPLARSRVVHPQATPGRQARRQLHPRPPQARLPLRRRTGHERRHRLRPTTGVPAAGRLDALKAIQAGTQERGAALPESIRPWATEVVSAALRKTPHTAQRVQAASELAKTLALKDAPPRSPRSSTTPRPTPPSASPPCRRSSPSTRRRSPTSPTSSPPRPSPPPSARPPPRPLRGQHRRGPPGPADADPRGPAGRRRQARRRPRLPAEAPTR